MSPLGGYVQAKAESSTVQELKFATGRNKAVGNDSNTGTKSRIWGQEWTMICLSVRRDALLSEMPHSLLAID